MEELSQLSLIQKSEIRLYDNTRIMWHLWGMLLSSPKVAEVTGLYRFPVKGCSADTLEQVVIASTGETFPDDRRFALLWKKSSEKWNETHPEWLHKENFLCAFTDAQLFSEYVTTYQIVSSNEATQSYGLPCDTVTEKRNTTGKSRRNFTVRKRSTDEVVLGPVDLSTVHGRQQVASFFGDQSGKDVVCVTAAATTTTTDNHGHQFGNTASGVKARGDTRTIHMVNAATVRELSDTLGLPLNPTRFRPNIVIDGLEPWEEFKWVDKSIRCGNVKLNVIKRTVRCDGISIDPLDAERVLDIPKLLTKHYPQHGPFFGVYAVIDEAGSMSVGDDVRLL